MAKRINAEIGADISGLQAGLKAAANSMEQAGNQMATAAESVNSKTEKSVKSLQQAYRATYKDAQLLAQQQGTNSDAFREAARAAAAYKDELEDVQDAIKAASSEQRWKLVGGAIGAAVDVAQGMVGVMTLIGLESANAEKAIAAMLALQGISSAITGIITLKDAFTALNTQIIATSATMTMTLGTVAKIAAGVVAAIALLKGTPVGEGSTTGAFKPIDEVFNEAKRRGAFEKPTQAPKAQKTATPEIKGYSNLFTEIQSKDATLGVKKLTDSFLELKRVSTDAFITGAQGMTRFQEVIDSISDEIGQQLQDLAVNGFGMFAEMVGASLAGQDVDFGRAAAMMMADIASTIGKSMISIGVPMLFIPGMQGHGAAYLAGGAAIMAVAGALKAGSAPSASGGGGSAATPAKGGGFTPSFQPTALTVMIDGRIKGSDIVIASYNTDRKNKRVK